MAQPRVHVHADGRLYLTEEGRTYFVNAAGPGVCTCGGHRPGAPCRHVAAVRASFRRSGPRTSA